MKTWNELCTSVCLNCDCKGSTAKISEVGRVHDHATLTDEDLRDFLKWVYFSGHPAQRRKHGEIIFCIFGTTLEA